MTLTIPKTAKDLFRSQREAWIETARAEATKLLKRGKPYVTINDVTERVPRPSYLHHNVAGSVFNKSLFEQCGYEDSTRPAARGHVIKRWRLKDGS